MYHNAWKQNSFCFANGFCSSYYNIEEYLLKFHLMSDKSFLKCLKHWNIHSTNNKICLLVNSLFSFWRSLKEHSYFRVAMHVFRFFFPRLLIHTSSCINTNICARRSSPLISDNTCAVLWLWNSLKTVSSSKFANFWFQIFWHMWRMPFLWEESRCL